MKTRENSNFDLLKIICIALIIGHHFIYDAKILNLIDTSNIFYNFLYIGGKFGTAIFSIITGYFMSERKFNWNKIIKLMLKIEIYSYLSIIFFHFLLDFNIDKNNLVKSFIPILSNKYWFATSYIILYFLIPYLNILIKNISKEKYTNLLVILTFLIVILPTIGLNYLSNNTTALIYYYLIGAYIKKYDITLFKNNTFNLVSSIIVYILILLSTNIINLLSNKYTFFYNKTYYFSQINSIPVVISGILLFIFISQIKIKPHKILNRISIASLGIYLIHDNYFIKKYIFPRIFQIINNFSLNIIVSLMFIIMVIIICSIIDNFITIIIDKILIKINNKKFKI